MGDFTSTAPDGEPNSANPVAPASAVDLAIPGVVVAERLGRGGFATVYRGRQEALDRDVAVKILSGDLSQEEDARRFTNECRAVGRLSANPHVIDIYEAGVTTRSLGYLVMPYCRNGSLADLLGQRGPLPPMAVVDVGIALASALQAAHDQGIIHRDVKPENVLVSDHGRPLLSDFGVAAMSDVQGRFTSSIAFSRTHAAPEVLASNEYGPASDIYSLGSTLFTLLAGSPPFEGTTEAQQLTLIRTTPLRAINRPGIPQGLVDVLEQALAPNPLNRFQKAAAVARALQLVRAESGAAGAAAPGDSGLVAPRGVATGPTGTLALSPTTPTTANQPRQASEPSTALYLTVWGIGGAAAGVLAAYLVRTFT